MDKNSKIATIIIIAIIVIGGIYLSINKKEDIPQSDVTSQNDGKISVQTSPVSDSDKDGVIKEKGSYEAYSPEKIAKASTDHNVVLFFRASWCPTCRAVDADIKANLDEIPSSVTILDVNYDDSSELKKKYAVTYQHTFVQVDIDGNLIKKWVGSPTLSSLVSEII